MKWYQVTATALLLYGVALIVLSAATSVPLPPPRKCVSAEDQERLRTLALQGIDEAFKNHTVHLFDIWISDPSDQPKRASKGMQDSIDAYLRARSDSLKWSPPNC